MGYGDSYAQGVTNTLLRQGDAAANARLRQGDIAARTLGQLGQIASALPDDITQARQEQRATAEVQEAATLAQQLRMADGQPDWMKVADVLEQKSPMSPVAAEIRKRAQAQQKSLLDTRNTESEITTREGNLVVGQTNAATAAGKLAADAATAQVNAKREADIKAVLQKHVDPGSGVIVDWSKPIAELGSLGFTKEADEFAKLAKTQQPEKVTFGAPTPAMVGGKRVFFRTGSDGKTYDMAGKVVEQTPTPIVPERAPEPLEAIVGPNGQSILVPRSQAVGKMPATNREKSTEDERKSVGFYKQMRDAISTIDELEDSITEKELYQIQSLPQEDLIGMANRGQLSEAAKRYLRAFEQFTESRLRPVSGAAINDSEYARDRRTYAKQFKETPKLNEDRKRARNLALDSLGERAGVLKPKNEDGGGSGPVSVKAPDGQTYHFPNQAAADEFKRKAGIK